MKFKKIIFSMVSILILMAMVFSQSALAETLNPARVFVELNLENNPTGLEGDYWVDYDRTPDPIGEGKRVFRIGEQTGTGVTRKYNFYCGVYGRGFTQTARTLVGDETIYTDTYPNKYDMSNAEDKSTIQSAPLSLYAGDAYNQILALADQFYLGTENTEFDEYGQNVLAAAFNDSETFSANEITYLDIKNSGNLITEDQVRIVQQLALWYFTNGIDVGTTKAESLNTAFLHYQTSATSKASSLANGTDKDKLQNLQAIVLYKYLIKTAKANAANKNQDTDVYLYTNFNDATYTQPIIEIVPRSKLFDLALRKFITKIENTEGQDRYTAEDYAEREPEIGAALTGLENVDEITYRKEHSKKPLEVVKGDIVTYTIRIYNEGQVAGTATRVTDVLPEGLEFYNGGTINSIWSNPSNDKKTYVTEALKNEVIKPCDGDYTKLNNTDYYREVKIQCVVKGTSAKLKNVAEITEDSNDDVDSTPGEGTPSNDNYNKDGDKSDGRGYEDDDDFEDLKLKIFDLALRKHISYVKTGNSETTYNESGKRLPNVIEDNLNDKADTTAEYRHKKDPVEVQTGSKVQYTLTVYNEGNVDGYAKVIKDILPTGVKFLRVVSGNYKEDPNNLYANSNNNTVTLIRTTENVLKGYTGNNDLDSAEHSEKVVIECEVIDTPSSTVSKTYTNVAWIAEDWNERGYEDIDSEPENPENVSQNPNDFRTTGEGTGYRGKGNDSKTLSDDTQYFKGQEDDDDFEKIVLRPKKFDLALRKFITEIKDTEGQDRYTEQDYKDREPTIGPALEEGVNEGETTYEKKHKKTPLGVVEGDIVTYKIRVYNEGQIAGAATKITDHLPEGLTLYEGGTINGEEGYNWKVDTTDTTGRTIYTEKLAGTVLQPCNGDYTKLNEEGYYADVEIQCVVTGDSRKLKNVAEITEDSDDDNDSTPGEGTPSNDNYDKDGDTSDGRGYEDDDDFEDLKLIEFDLALRKYITKVENEKNEVVENIENVKGEEQNRLPEEDVTPLTKDGKTTANYNHRKDPVEVKNGYFVHYSLTIYNEGSIDGYATTITDQLPTGVKFVNVVDEENANYKLKNYNEETNTVIFERKETAIEKLKAFDGKKLDSETIEILCVVSVDEDTSDVRLTNLAWISGYYNDQNAKDRDSDVETPKVHPNKDELVTKYDGSDENEYIGKGNEDKDLSDGTKYFEGQQDDDDFEKLVIYKEPDVHKGVKDVKNQDSGYDDKKEYVDENGKKVNTEVPQEWVIQSDLPVDIKNYKEYVIVDDIDYRLVYREVKSVNIIDKDGKIVKELKADEDYKLDYKENTSTENSEILKNKYSGTITLTFIEPENEELKTVKDYPGNKIEVRFTTTFAKDSNGKLLAEIIGKDIPNKAKLKYSNALVSEGEKETEEPEVHTGGITLYKYKSTSKGKVGLEDAEFAIYRTEADAKANKNVVQTAKSDKNGLVAFVGLEYGEDAMDDKANLTAKGLYEYDSSTKSTDYWVVETKAPKGYKTITEPIKVTINNDSYKEDISVLVKEEESKEVATRLVENKPLEFDLSLRKFITDVNDKNVSPSREPVVDVSKLKDGTSTTATYTHPKDPVDVVNSDIVTYSLRIYNEGQIDGYASVVTDDIPDGLEFLPENSLNKEYRWVMYEEVTDESKVKEGTEIIECKVKDDEKVKKFIETKDASKASIIRTDYLSKEQGEDNLIKAFDGEKLDYKDVKLAFKVIEPNGSERVLINYAQISEDTDENGDEVDDRDSKTNEWNEGEDDQDIEKVRVPIFDLALRKWVTQAIVIENGKQTVTNTGHDAWDDPEDVVKVELHRKKLTDVTVKFRYSIRVYNQGEIAGYAKEVTDYIPAGLKFVAEDNKGWTDEGNNVISTRLLENTLLQPGEFADVEVLLTWINGTDNLGLKVNTAEISEDYNEKHVPDKDSVPDNKKPGEDDIDDAPVMLSVSTGSEVTYFALGLGILVVIAGGIFLIKKYVL